MASTVDKPTLRASLRTARKAFVEQAASADHLFVLNLQVAEIVAPQLAGAYIVSAYLSDGDEVDPLPILFRAIEMGMTVALPRVSERDLPMTFHGWYPGDDLVPGPYGLVQPRADAPRVDPDLILTPLLGYDRALNRIGQGAGFYDRVFDASPAARRIGLAWSAQQVNAVPCDPWDVPLHGVATERGWITA